MLQWGLMPGRCCVAAGSRRRKGPVSRGVLAPVMFGNWCHGEKPQLLRASLLFACGVRELVITQQRRIAVCDGMLPVCQHPCCTSAVNDSSTSQSRFRGYGASPLFLALT